MTRRLKLMPEYCAWPLWERDPQRVGPINPSSLPLSAPTVAALGAWASWHESFLNFASPLDSRTVSPDEQAAFSAEGRRLWRVLREELGPDYEIAYFEDGQLFEHAVHNILVAIDGEQPDPG
jgi:hypothetical protein